jgi:formate dehydrogenase subunit gamma
MPESDGGIRKMAIDGIGQDGKSILEGMAVVVEKERQIKRFEIQQILQHIVMMVSFTLLVLTGLPMKFNTLASSDWWVALLGGINTVRSIHHISAYVMVALCFYHLGYIIISIVVSKKPFPTAIVPNYKDFITFYQEILYFLGLRSAHPQFDRFNWREKFDYWAIFWGIPVMAGSGFVLLFPVAATEILPALIMHSAEAMVALGWILLVHVFFNHFSPGVFPLNKSIFTGKVPEERYKREHPVEWERIKDKLPK